MAEMTKDESKDSLSLMVIPVKYGSISKEAREMEMFTEGIYTKFIGLAIVTSAIHQRLLGTLFFKFKKAKSPTEILQDLGATSSSTAAHPMYPCKYELTNPSFQFLKISFTFSLSTI